MAEPELTTVDRLNLAVAWLMLPVGATSAVAVITLLLTVVGIISLSVAIAALLGAASIATVWSYATAEAPQAGGAKKRVEKAGGLRETEIWTDVLRAIPEPAVIIDGDAMVIIDNSAARDLLGKSMVRRKFETLSRDPELFKAVEMALSTGAQSTVQITARTPLERQLEATACPLNSGPSGSRFVLLTFHDISRQAQLTEMRSDFVANASHELRTPLASLRGFIETLQGPARHDEDARSRFLSIMAVQAERMTRLIDDLLLLSRVEERAFLPPKSQVDVKTIIEEAIEFMVPLADQRKITIELRCTDDSLALTGDRDELFQVFQNLIENAVKYGRDGGWIAITASRKRVIALPVAGKATDTIVVTVADNGEGIAPEHLPRLTERFYRVNADRSRKIGGTGLGLAIVKHVLNRHGGTLRYASQVGAGTTARVELPAI